MKVFTSENCIDSGAIGLRRYNNAQSCPLHCHEFIEIVYISDGEALEVIDGVEYKVKRGDMIFINCGATHSFTSDTPFSHIEIFFSPNLVYEGVITPANALALLALSSFDDMRKDQNGGKISFSGEERREIEFILEAMLKERKDKERGTLSVVENYLNILLIKMLRRADAADVLADDIWEGLKEYIDNSPEEHMTLTALASKCFYNPSYFSRVFKHKFGSSPTEYIKNRRIERAMALLENEDISIEQIIQRSGFSDRSTFYHAFSKKNGMTPAEYRAKFKK